MIDTRIHEKGILAKFLEQCIKILLIKECKKISNIKIDIISSSTQIIKGEIQKISIFAKDINYKDLLFDKFNLEANHLKIKINLSNKELYLKNNPKINFKISFSQDSLRTILLSKSWGWIGNLISKEMLNHERIEDIRINNGQLFINSHKKNININQLEQLNIRTEKGKVYIRNQNKNKILQIPIEDKIYIENVNIENNLIDIFGNSSISF